MGCTACFRTCAQGLADSDWRSSIRVEQPLARQGPSGWRRLLAGSGHCQAKVDAPNAAVATRAASAQLHKATPEAEPASQS